MTSHPLINRLAVAVLLISAAVLGATVQRDMPPSQTRCICGRNQSPHHLIAHHAGSPSHTNHTSLGKAALGLAGERCRTTAYGEGYELRPTGSCTVAFLFPVY